jgi:hypothetical protein
MNCFFIGLGKGIPFAAVAADSQSVIYWILNLLLVISSSDNQSFTLSSGFAGVNSGFKCHFM